MLQISEAYLLSKGAKKIIANSNKYVFGYGETLYTNEEASLLERAYADEAVAWVKPGTTIYFLFDNICNDEKFNKLYKKWHGILQMPFHVAKCQTKGCGGITEYYYITSNDIEVK